MASTIEKLLEIQQQGDDFLSGTSRLRSMIGAIRAGNKFACVDGPVDIDEVRDNYYTYMTASYKPFVSVLSQYIRTNIPSSAVGNGTIVEVAFDSGNASFVGDLVVLISIPAITASMLSVVQNAPIVPVPGYGLIRYCKYPGIRLFQKVEFLINSKVVESYTSDNVLDYRFNEIDVGKIAAFDQCVGQETMNMGRYSYNADQTGAPIAPGTQLWTGFTNGPQTSSVSQPPLVLAVPILFNWCRDNAVPMLDDYVNVKQRTIRITLAPLTQIVSQYVDMPVAVLPGSFQFTNMTIFTRSIFMDKRMVELFKRPQKQVIRTYRSYTYSYQGTGPQNLSLDGINYPVECMYVKFVPKVNVTEATTMSGANISTYDYWFVPAQMTKSNLAVSMLSPQVGTGALFQNGVNYEFYSAADLVSGVTMSILDVDLFGGAVPPKFLTSYVPWGERSILQASQWPGTYIFNFSQQYRGDLTRTAAGYLDFTQLQNKLLSFTLTSKLPLTLILNVRFLNFFEPTPGGLIQYTYPIS